LDLCNTRVHCPPLTRRPPPTRYASLPLYTESSKPSSESHSSAFRKDSVSSSHTPSSFSSLSSSIPCLLFPPPPHPISPFGDTRFCGRQRGLGNWNPLPTNRYCCGVALLSFINLEPTPQQPRNTWPLSGPLPEELLAMAHWAVAWKR